MRPAADPTRIRSPRQRPASGELTRNRNWAYDRRKYRDWSEIAFGEGGTEKLWQRLGAIYRFAKRSNPFLTDAKERLCAEL